MTIDPLSIFFWAATLCTLWRALEKSPDFSLWWPLSGVLIGVGFLCKWTNAFQLLGVLLLLAMTPRYRRELLRPGFWSMLAAFAPALWPPWHWQEPRGWPLLHHLSARGGLETPWWKIDFAEFGKFFASHFGVYSPLIFAAMLVALWVAGKDSLQRWGNALLRAIPAFPRSMPTHPLVFALILFVALTFYFLGNWFDDIPAFHLLAVATPILAAIIGIARCKDEANIHWKSRFLTAFALPVALTYLWISLHHDSEVNWTAPAAVTVAILAVAHWLDRVSRALATTALALGGVMTIVGMNPGIVRAIGIPWPLKYDHTSRLRKWADTAKSVADFRKQYEQQTGQPVFLIGENYGLAAELCYYLPEKRIESPGQPACYVEESPVAANQFHFWPRYDEYEERTAPVRNDQEDSERGTNKFAGRTALYITARDEQKPPSVLKRTFEKWELATVFELKENGQPLRTIRVFICHHYKPGLLLD
jgi:hypothetical protein